MKKILKKSCAVLIAALMLATTPLLALAAGQFNMTLSTNDVCYAGITYDIVATIDNLSESALIGDENTESAFTWSTDNGAPVNSTNDYRISKNADNTYTVTETAKVALPSEVGTTVISAKYGNSASRSLTITTKQPITSLNVYGVSDSGDEYYYKKSSDTSDDVLYLNSYVSKTNFGTAELGFEEYPALNDDSLAIAASDARYLDCSSNDDGTRSFKFTDAKAPENTTITISPRSGYGYTKKISLVECTALTSFKLSTDTFSFAEACKKSEFNNSWSGLTTIAGQSITISPTATKPTGSNTAANDTYDYKLYTDITMSTLAPSNYYSPNSDGSCSFNISNPGTYYLVCSAVSKGGYLKRDLAAFAAITVNESSPITSINLLKLDDENNLTKEPLEEIELYSSSLKTYDASKHLSIYPIGYTNGVNYLINDTSVATVSDKGIVTAKASGETTLYVYSDKDPSIVANCKVRVKTEIASINTITGEDGKAVTLPAGHSAQLVANTTPVQNDETIRWSSQNPDALTVSSAGYATANADYDFDGKAYVDVQVTATSELGKQQQTFVRVVPAVPAEKVEITAQNANKTDSNINSYTAYKGDTFTLSAVGSDLAGNETNDVFVWMVSVGNGQSMSLDNAKTYFDYTMNPTNTSCTITTKNAALFNFYCYAVKRGQSPTSTTIFGSASIYVYEKATKLSFINPSTGGAISSTTMATGGTYDIGITMSPVSAYDEDSVTFSSENEAIATVVKTSTRTATITAKNIQGSTRIVAKTVSGKTATFTVTVTNNINFAEVSGIEDSYEYNGSAINPVPTVTYNGLTLFKGVDYDLTYEDANGGTGTKCLNAGIAKIIIKGKGDYAASSKTVFFEIKPKSLANDNVPIGAITTTLGGGSIINGTRYYIITDKNPAPVPTITVKDADRANATLALNKDYTVECVNNTTSGIASAVITGTGNYTGTYVVNFNVCDNISKASVSKVANQAYNGTALTPNPVVTYNGTTLEKDVDYKVTYKANTEIGVATIIVTGIAPAFTGTTTATFNIVPKAVSGVKTKARTYSSITLSWTKDDKVTGYQIYDVSAKKVIKTITDKNVVEFKKTSLTAQKAYSYKIRAYKTIKGVNYYGAYSSVCYTYTLPKTPTITLKTGSKYVTASWKKNTAVSGYQYQYSTSSKFSGAKTYGLSNKSYAKKITGLKKGKRYYVRVRSYKKMTVKGKKVTVYSSWSTKSIVCK